MTASTETSQWLEYPAQAQNWSLKNLNIFILSVVGPTILEKRNQIRYVHFAIFCDSLLCKF